MSDDHVTAADTGRSLSDADQTLAESDQTLSDADQTASDRDQTSAENDQVAADRDQAASDRDLAAGVDQREHDITRDIRLDTAQQRQETARARLAAASRRDAAASARDLVADARDEAAMARDLAIVELDAAEARTGGRAEFGLEILLRAAEHRARAAQYRVQAAEHREMAAADRRAAAADRQHAANERRHALADREMSAAALVIAETDGLTGARTRAAGLSDLAQEVERSHRTGSGVVIAYIDVVGLKAVNDALGHTAGDALLVHVTSVSRAHLRPYDLIVRLGGDEFVCVMPNLTESEARRRLAHISEAIASPPHSAKIRTGFAALRAQETSSDLIARADADMTGQRLTADAQSRNDRDGDGGESRPRVN